MMRRSFRVLVLLLTVVVTAGVVWRATVNEQARGRMRLAAQQNDAAAADAIFELTDLRSSLHAYVAPGQGLDFWSKRARAQIDSLNTRLRAVEPAATAAGHPLGTARSSLDGLATAEARARRAVADGLPLVAGDILFTEARDLIDAAARDLSDARQLMARAESAREVGTANAQSLLAGALIAVWIFALIVLVPVPVVPPDREELRRGGPVAGPAPPEPAAVASVRPETTNVPADEPVLSPPGAAPASSVPVPEAPPGASFLPLLERAAALCTDIGRVSDASELRPLLAQAATLLGARGVVVWLLAPDGQHLTPAIAHGYDEQILGRMGSIPIEDHNLTATAFRTGRPAHAARDGGTPGAVAVPMLSATGACGVLAAEVSDGTDVGQAEAMASLLAAQLASLFPTSESVSLSPSHAGR